MIKWFDAQETIIVNVETSCVQFFFRIISWIESWKERHLSEIERFCNIITTIQNFGVSKSFLLLLLLLLLFFKGIKEINIFIQQGFDQKWQYMTFIMLQKLSISVKSCFSYYFIFIFCSSKNPENKLYTTAFNI